MSLHSFLCRNICAYICTCIPKLYGYTNVYQTYSRTTYVRHKHIFSENYTYHHTYTRSVEPTHPPPHVSAFSDFPLRKKRIRTNERAAVARSHDCHLSSPHCSRSRGEFGSEAGNREPVGHGSDAGSEGEDGKGAISERRRRGFHVSFVLLRRKTMFCVFLYSYLNMCSLSLSYLNNKVDSGLQGATWQCLLDSECLVQSHTQGTIFLPYKSTAYIAQPNILKKKKKNKKKWKIVSHDPSDLFRSVHICSDLFG